MGKAANQAAWAEFERLDRQKDEAVEAMSEAPLSEEERAATWDDSYWERLDAVRRYARPVCRVSLFDEHRGI